MKKANTARRVALVCAFLATACAAWAQNPAPAPAAAASGAAPSGGKPYKVVDGFYVDDFTLQGFHTWRSAACDRCHGANQQGMVGPSLIDSLKVLSKADFVTTLTNGRLEKGMPSWAGNKDVMDHIDNLYAYLKGRSDGALTQSHVQPISQAPSASAAAK